MSASSCWVTCGIVVQLLTRFGPESFLIRESSTRSVRSPDSPFAAGGAPRRAGRLLDVLLGDPPLAAGALHLREVDPLLAREPAHGRAGVRGRLAVGLRGPFGRRARRRLRRVLRGGLRLGLRGGVHRAGDAGSSEVAVRAGASDAAEAPLSPAPVSIKSSSVPCATLSPT